MCEYRVYIILCTYIYTTYYYTYGGTPQAVGCSIKIIIIMTSWRVHFYFLVFVLSLFLGLSTSNFIISTYTDLRSRLNDRSSRLHWPNLTSHSTTTHRKSVRTTDKHVPIHYSTNTYLSSCRNTINNIVILIILCKPVVGCTQKTATVTVSTVYLYTKDNIIITITQH